MHSASTSSSANRWATLVVVCLAQFMVILDATIVNVALPSIQRGLHFSTTDLQWVINSYTLMFGGFLLLGGRAADFFGRRRLFLAGVVVFSAASLINGLASSSEMLIVGRGLQGLGGALVSPAALSIITTTFAEGPDRNKALGVWSAIAAGGAAVGLLLGGVLTDFLSWEWCFFVNVPVGILAVLAALRYVPNTLSEHKPDSIDIAGAVAVTSGLVVLVYAIVKAQTWGFGSGQTLGLAAVAAALLATFVWIETRSKAPLVRLGIFRKRTLTGANIGMTLTAAGMFSMFFFATLYIQEVLGYSPLKAGLAFLPVTALIIVGAGVAQQGIKRIGARMQSVVGISVAAGGMFLLTGLPVDGSYVSDLLPGLLLIAFGMGMTFVPITLMATTGVHGDDQGLASGLLNTAQQVGGALGLAALSTVAFNHAASHGGSKVEALVSGYTTAFTVSGILLAAGAALILVLIRRDDVAHIATGDQPALAAA
ncbi:MAG TPA: MFS transporter [Thermoleophilaceae bacterium]|nr:MFS transporter [Thermoleophilaceae bacterium]